MLKIYIITFINYIFKKKMKLLEIFLKKQY